MEPKVVNQALTAEEPTAGTVDDSPSMVGEWKEAAD
jgi:hypothetical protein